MSSTPPISIETTNVSSTPLGIENRDPGVADRRFLTERCRLAGRSPVRTTGRAAHHRPAGSSTPFRPTGAAGCGSSCRTVSLRTMNTPETVVAGHRSDGCGRYSRPHDVAPIASHRCLRARGRLRRRGLRWLRHAPSDGAAPRTGRDGSTGRRPDHRRPTAAGDDRRRRRLASAEHAPDILQFTAPSSAAASSMPPSCRASRRCSGSGRPLEAPATVKPPRSRRQASSSRTRSTSSAWHGPAARTRSRASSTSTA